MAPPEPVGDFYAHVLRGQAVDAELTSSTKLLRGQPTVIHFYNGGWGGCRPCAAQMQRWAARFPVVRFLCVCVESLRVARQFQAEFGFERAVNCHIPGRSYMPVGYGQLGCSGFVVADRDGCFVSRRTRAYLDYGDAAFAHVEELLRAQLGEAAAPGIGIGIGPPATRRDNSEGEAAEAVEEEEEEEEEKKVEPPPSVGVRSMDHEHERCADAMSLLLETRSAKSLELVLTELIEHFDHEERLMRKHGFGDAGGGGDGDGGAFSPFRSHVKDHERILEIGFRELSRVGGAGQGQGQGCSDAAAACSGGTWRTGGAARAPSAAQSPAVSPAVATEIVRAFNRHAESFDVLYADHIPSTAD